MTFVHLQEEVKQTKVLKLNFSIKQRSRVKENKKSGKWKKLSILECGVVCTLYLPSIRKGYPTHLPTYTQLLSPLC